MGPKKDRDAARLRSIEGGTTRRRSRLVRDDGFASPHEGAADGDNCLSATDYRPARRVHIKPISLRHSARPYACETVHQATPSGHYASAMFWRGSKSRLLVDDTRRQWRPAIRHAIEIAAVNREPSMFGSVREMTLMSVD